jgi:small subunit ribosomal protein S1
MVHISDLSWTKRYSHPSEFTKVGERLMYHILEVDEDNQKTFIGSQTIGRKSMGYF